MCWTGNLPSNGTSSISVLGLPFCTLDDTVVASMLILPAWVSSRSRMINERSQGVEPLRPFALRSVKLNNFRITSALPAPHRRRRPLRPRRLELGDRALWDPPSRLPAVRRPPDVDRLQFAAPDPIEDRLSCGPVAVRQGADRRHRLARHDFDPVEVRAICLHPSRFRADIKTFSKETNCTPLDTHRGCIEWRTVGVGSERAAGKCRRLVTESFRRSESNKFLRPQPR